MQLPKIIQGGMGVGVSNWHLARAVCVQHQLGVVSGTGINTVMIRRLQRGDEGGHLRRAFLHFTDQGIVRSILNTFFVEGGIGDGETYARSPLPSMTPTMSWLRQCVVAAFAEVWLAKQGHSGLVGINVLEKLQMSNLPVLYGAMLAGVDVVLMGAGVPREIPGVLDRFASHGDATIGVGAVDGAASRTVPLTFRPSLVIPSAVDVPMTRPLFLPIVSSNVLATHLVQRSTGRVDGFVVEGVVAGGHNAPPRGKLALSATGEPVYGPKDDANVEAIREIGLPFWLAGAYGSAERLVEALNMGAQGIQVGTAFAFCDESGIAAPLKQQVIDMCMRSNAVALDAVFTDPLASPTGFPFKVVQLPGTLSEQRIYDERPRKCDLGYLRQAVIRTNGKFAYRCAAEPAADFAKKGGDERETVNRKCLCNALTSNIGLGQTQEDGTKEQALLTAGDDLAGLLQCIPPGATHYSASDVISTLLGTTA